jgi:hypothetical protein
VGTVEKCIRPPRATQTEGGTGKVKSVGSIVGDSVGAVSPYNISVKAYVKGVKRVRQYSTGISAVFDCIGNKVGDSNGNKPDVTKGLCIAPVFDVKPDIPASGLILLFNAFFL